MRNGSGSDQAADCLALAAAPTFTLMALLTSMGGDGHPTFDCTHAGLLPPLHGMAPMYMLMAVFHLERWFRRTR
jgi:hypothetical protein